MASGERPPYARWRRLDVQPDDATCLECFDPAAFQRMPIDFWSPAAKWGRFGVSQPCVTHGWAHAHFTTLGEWRQRRVKGRETDRCVAGQRVYCGECHRTFKRLKKQRDALKVHNPRSPRIAELQAELDSTQYTCAPSPPQPTLPLKPPR